LRHGSPSGEIEALVLFREKAQRGVTLACNAATRNAEAVGRRCARRMRQDDSASGIASIRGVLRRRHGRVERETGDRLRGLSRALIRGLR
jgi:hypothetical protein